MFRNAALTLLAAVCFISADSNAQNASRLIARHSRNWNHNSNTWIANDSANYTYSNGRGGGLTSPLKYDTSYRLEHDGSDYNYTHKFIQTFNSNNVLTERLMMIYNGGTFNNASKTTFTYDNNGNLQEELRLAWANGSWKNNQRITHTYDGNSNRLLSRDENWYAGNWQDGQMWIYTYDGNNNMVTSAAAVINTTTQTWDTASKDVMHYNNNNLKDTIWHYYYVNGNGYLNTKVISVYDNSNNLVLSLRQGWNNTSSSWVDAARTFRFINTNNQFLGDSTQVWDVTTNAWVNAGRQKVTFGNNNFPAATLKETWDATTNLFVNDHLDSTDYNTFGELTWKKGWNWDVAMLSWVGYYGSSDNHYYYEPYTSDIKNIVQGVGSLNVYPSPASGAININIRWDKAQDFTIAVYDMQGRLVTQWGEKPIIDYKKTIPVSELASGTYIIQVRSKDARAQQPIVILQ